MKKNRIFWASAVIAALTLTACTDQTDFNQVDLQNAAAENAPGAIQFGTYLGTHKLTRAGSKGVIDTEILKVPGYGFGVLAFNTANTPWASAGSTTKPNFMYNENVYWDGGSKWIYDNVKYWPNDFNNGPVDREDIPNTAIGSGTYKALLSFFAYAPYVNMTTYLPTSATDVTIDPSSENISTKYFGASETTEGIVAMTFNEKVGNPLLKYILKDATSTNSVDLLWGLRGNTSGYDLANGATEGAIGAYNTDLTKQTVNEKVNFMFKHALAKIVGHDPESSTDKGDFKTGLQVILDIDKDGAISGGSKNKKTLVTVDDVLIEDWYTYNKRIDASTTEKSDFMTEGWFDIAQGKWYDVKSDVGTGNGVTYNSGTTTTNSTGAQGKLNPDIAEPITSISNTAGLEWTLDGSVREGVVETKAKDVYSADSDVPAVFMIPAPTGTGNDQTLVVTITYTVRTYDNHLAPISDGVGTSTGTWTKVKQKITNAVTIPGGSLDANKYYKLLMHLGLTSVKFTASVADWDEATNTDSDDDGVVDDPKDADKDIYLPSNTLSSSTADVEELAVANVDMLGAASQDIVLPYKAGTYNIFVKNAAPSTATEGNVSVTGSLTGASATSKNSVVQVVISADNLTASNKTLGTLTLTDHGATAKTIDVVVKQGVGSISLTASSTLVEATSGTSTITAKIDDATLTLANTDITVSPTATVAASGVITFPENKTAERISYVATVNPSGSNTNPVTITIEQKSGAIQAERDGSGDVSASKGAGSTVTIIVKDTQDSPTTLDLTNTSKYKSSVEVKCGSENVTGNCTIQKTTTGVVVVLPANSTSSTKTYEIKVTVNDATTATAISVTQSAAN